MGIEALRAFILGIGVQACGLEVGLDGGVVFGGFEDFVEVGEVVVGIIFVSIHRSS